MSTVEARGGHFLEKLTGVAQQTYWRLKNWNRVAALLRWRLLAGRTAIK